MLAHAYAMPEPPEPEAVTPAIGRLADLRVPVSIIVGAQDIPDIHTIADLLVDGITDVDRVIIPNAAHMVNMEKPAHFNQTVLDFL
jgi:pimeloyl-ACP methyl ester carboxylesterase